MDEYIQKFLSFRRDYSYGGAPHKPVLLLSVLELIETDVIGQNKIYISPELISKFQDVWEILVDTPHNQNISLPFYHLKNDGLWHLKLRPGMAISVTKSHSIRSFKNLIESIEYAYLDEELYQLLQDQSSRNIFRQALLGNIFLEQRIDIVGLIKRIILSRYNLN